MVTTYDLPAWHLQALVWFEQNAGREFDKRPFDVGLATKVTSQQRGIWKPGASKYALSVVQTHKGIYDDLDPDEFEDGTWEYYYHQEGKSAADLRDPERLYSNAGLYRCMEDGIPVGVIIPAESGRGYKVLGLALVISHDAGYFRLLGPVDVSHMTLPVVAEHTGRVSASLIDYPMVDFDPNAAEDNRLKVIAAVHRRQGGPRFRRALLAAYDGLCAVTRYDAPAALEAAHIVPYRGPQTNHITNGLLLRADVHDLFDLGLVAVDAGPMRLILAKELAGTRYERYSGEQLWLPSDPELRPNEEALEKHRLASKVA